MSDNTECSNKCAFKVDNGKYCVNNNGICPNNMYLV